MSRRLTPNWGFWPGEAAGWTTRYTGPDDGALVGRHDFLLFANSYVGGLFGELWRWF